MGIEKPIIAAVQKTRAKVKHTAIRIADSAPPNEVYFQNPYTGEVSVVSQEPEREGQMVIHRPLNTDFVYMYVVIDIDGTLTWMPVVTQVVIQQNGTGRKHDPSAHFYTRLAS